MLGQSTNYEPIKYHLTDFILYNHKELLDLVLNEDFGLRSSGERDPIDFSLDSQVERFITSSQHRLYIINISVRYLSELANDSHKIYYMKFEDQLNQDEIARNVQLSKNTVTSRINGIRDGLLNEWDESGIFLENIFRFRQKYRWVGNERRRKTA